MKLRTKENDDNWRKSHERQQARREIKKELQEIDESYGV